MSSCYLEQFPPRRSQFRRVRRQEPSGVTVLHTAENMLDAIGADSGAENVARFICTRTTPGSYHDLCDSDSAIQLVPYDAEAFQDGTGTNPHALSISWAIRAADWPRLSPARRDALLMQAAGAFARQQAWLREHGYARTPLRRITAHDADRHFPGFVTHGDRDPGRRSDPGAAFPWDAWFAACRVALGSSDPQPPSTEDDDMRVAHRPDGLAVLVHGGRIYPLAEGEVPALRSLGVPVKPVTDEEFRALERLSEFVRTGVR